MDAGGADDLKRVLSARLRRRQRCEHGAGADKQSGGATQRRRVTIADIARKAGVSMATVSRVLHNTGQHSEETRRAVMKVVSEFDFQLNDTAASLAMMRNTSSQS